MKIQLLSPWESSLSSFMLGRMLLFLIYLEIHFILFEYNKDQSGTYQVPGTVLDNGHTGVKKEGHCLQRAALQISKLLLYLFIFTDMRKYTEKVLRYHCFSN